MKNPSEVRRAGTQIWRALLGAALLLGAAATLKWLSPEHITPELSRRLLGALMGSVVVIFANTAPKTLTPLARLRCDPATEQAIRRFSAWSLVLGGVAYMVVWLVAPIDIANWLATALLGTSLLLVVARCAMGRATRLRT